MISDLDRCAEAVHQVSVGGKPGRAEVEGHLLGQRPGGREPSQQPGGQGKGLDRERRQEIPGEAEHLQGHPGRDPSERGHQLQQERLPGIVLMVFAKVEEGPRRNRRNHRGRPSGESRAPTSAPRHVRPAPLADVRADGLRARIPGGHRLTVLARPGPRIQPEASPHTGSPSACSTSSRWVGPGGRLGRDGPEVTVEGDGPRRPRIGLPGALVKSSGLARIAGPVCRRPRRATPDIARIAAAPPAYTSSTPSC